MIDEDVFNQEVRKFLKQVGVTSQREIERAVREAVEAGRLDPDRKLKASVHLKVEGLGLEHTVESELRLK